MEKKGKAFSFPVGNLSPNLYNRRPFRNLGPQERRNLALAAIASFYSTFIAYFLITAHPFVPLGLDFIAFWSAGYVANTASYSKIYDFEFLTKVQFSFVPVLEHIGISIPFFFLTPFVLPLRLFALLPPFPSFLLWAFLNFLALVCYLGFLARSANVSEKRKVLTMLLLSYPVFLNFYYGQINVWLGIFIGEFMRALMKGKPWKAGAWLAGLLLKPQTLVLLLPSLALGGEYKVIGGFALTSLVLLVLSTLMSGVEGLKSMLALWARAAKGDPDLKLRPDCMMNWRALGLQLEALVSTTAVWIIAGIGMALTALLAFYLWLKPLSRDEKALATAILGTIAATASFAWHFHFYTGIILLPPLIYLAESMPRYLLDAWVFAPVAVLFFVYLIGALLRLAGITLQPAYGCPFITFCFLVLNLSLLLWCVRQKRKAIGL